MTKGLALVLALVLIGVGGLAGFWFYFHTLPRESELQQSLRNADVVEIFRFKAKPIRWVRLENPSDWADLADRIRFREAYWRFSDEPADSIVIQAIRNGERIGVFEVRGDECIHLRKAVRWYRMPIEPGFEERLREILERRGSDL